MVALVRLMGMKKAKHILQLQRILKISRTDVEPIPNGVHNEQLTPNTKQHLRGKKNLQYAC